MATRSRAGSSKTTKSSPTTATDASTQSTPEVTSTSLQRRELPSLSSSREARIAESAYWRAERRGFEAGHELDDWLAAEKEIDGEAGEAPREAPAGRTA